MGHRDSMVQTRSRSLISHDNGDSFEDDEIDFAFESGGLIDGADDKVDEGDDFLSRLGALNDELLESHYADEFDKQYAEDFEHYAGDLKRRSNDLTNTRRKKALLRVCLVLAFSANLIAGYFLLVNYLGDNTTETYLMTTQDGITQTPGEKAKEACMQYCQGSDCTISTANKDEDNSCLMVKNELCVKYDLSAKVIVL